MLGNALKFMVQSVLIGSFIYLVSFMILEPSREIMSVWIASLMIGLATCAHLTKMPPYLAGLIQLVVGTGAFTTVAVMNGWISANLTDILFYAASIVVIILIIQSIFIILAIRDSKKIEDAVNAVIQKYGKVDVLVNNAGVAKLTPFLETSDEIRDFHFDINIKGTWNMSKAVVPYMGKGASIVNLSSVTGTMVADTGEVAYATTKAAILGFTKGLAAEVVDKGIRVNAILPGYIMTPMVEGIAKDSDSNNPASVVEGIANGIPMKRLGTIEELGELAAFLASNEASYLTGQSYVIDGGSTLPETMSVGV